MGDSRFRSASEDDVHSIVVVIWIEQYLAWRHPTDAARTKHLLEEFRILTAKQIDGALGSGAQYLRLCDYYRFLVHDNNLLNTSRKTLFKARRCRYWWVLTIGQTHMYGIIVCNPVRPRYRVYVDRLTKYLKTHGKGCANPVRGF
jgi:hypothetical protein